MQCVMKDKIKFILAAFWQCTYGLLQSAMGAVVFLWFVRCTHFRYKNAIMTNWTRDDGVSLGLFAFVPKRSSKDMYEHLIRHEYGHCCQSMILGPLYLPLIGLPSIIWNITPILNSYRHKNRIMYETFYTESWANRLGGTDQWL